MRNRSHVELENEKRRHLKSEMSSHVTIKKSFPIKGETFNYPYRSQALIFIIHPFGRKHFHMKLMRKMMEGPLKREKWMLLLFHVCGCALPESTDRHSEIVTEDAFHRLSFLKGSCSNYVFVPFSAKKSPNLWLRLSLKRTLDWLCVYMCQGKHSAEVSWHRDLYVGPSSWPFTITSPHE